MQVMCLKDLADKLNQLEDITRKKYDRSPGVGLRFEPQEIT